MKWKKIFMKLENKLGYKFKDWQKDYIMINSNYIPNERQCGATTAYIFRYLLNIDVHIEMPNNRDYMWYINNIPEHLQFPCDKDIHEYNSYLNFYYRYVNELYEVCKSEGIETCFDK